MYLGRLVGPWSLVLFPKCRDLCFSPALFGAFLCTPSAREKGERPQPTHLRSKPTTRAVDLSAGAAIREDPASAAGACCCHTVVLLLLLLRRRLLLDLPFYVWSHFVLIKDWYDNSCQIFNVYVRRAWVLIPTCVVYIVAPCNTARVCALACFSGPTASYDTGFTYH